MPARMSHPIGHRAACRLVAGGSSSSRFTAPSTHTTTTTSTTTSAYNNNRCAIRREGADRTPQATSFIHCGGLTTTRRYYSSNNNEGNSEVDTSCVNTNPSESHGADISPSTSSVSVTPSDVQSGTAAPKGHHPTTSVLSRDSVAQVASSPSTSSTTTTHTRTSSADRARAATLRPPVATQSVSGADLRAMHKLFVQKQLTVLQRDEKTVPIPSSRPPSADGSEFTNVATNTDGDGVTSSSSSTATVSPTGIPLGRPDWKAIFSKPLPTSLTKSALPGATAQAFIAEVVKTVVARSPSRGHSPPKSSLAATSSSSPTTSTKKKAKSTSTTSTDVPVTLCPKIAKAIRRHERLRIEAIKRCTADIFLGLQHMPAVAVRQLLKRGITNKTIAHYVARIEQEETRVRKQAYIKSQCRRIEVIDRNLKDRGGLQAATDSSIAKWKASLSKAQKLEVRQLGAERGRVVKRLAKLKAKNDELVAEIEELEYKNIAIVEIAALDARDWCKKVDKQQRQKKRVNKHQIKPQPTTSD